MHVPTATILIPARMASSRFPGKVLAAQTGRPMVQHVVEAARRAACARHVVVAADDARIAEALHPYGTRVVFTREDHPNGTSRLAEAAALLALQSDDIVVNVQGDEPEIDPAVIDAAAGALIESGADVGTVACVMGEGEDDPNVVKVVRRADGCALYFSRSRIPYPRERGAAALRHVGVYAYRRAFLDQYVSLPPTPLERAESLEQLRVLEHGYRIAVAVVPAPEGGGIDTPEQYAAFVARWRSTAGG